MRWGLEQNWWVEGDGGREGRRMEERMGLAFAGKCQLPMIFGGGRGKKEEGDTFGERGTRPDWGARISDVIIKGRGFSWHYEVLSSSSRQGHYVALDRSID